MFWKRGGEKKVYNITFIVTDSIAPIEIPGYTAINTDLNAGAGGPYIWAYYSTDEANVLDRSRKPIELRAGNRITVRGPITGGGKLKDDKKK